MTDRDATILRLYQQGMLIKSIAAEVGMAPNSVGYVLKKLGVERPAKPQKRWNGREDPTEEIINLWGHGLCASQIAERLQEGLTIVNSVLTAAGVRNPESPRHRYDGIGGIGRARRDRSGGAFARIARRA